MSCSFGHRCHGVTEPGRWQGSREVGQRLAALEATSRNVITDNSSHGVPGQVVTSQDVSWKRKAKSWKYVMVIVIVVS